MRRPVAARKTPARKAATPNEIRQVWLMVARMLIGNDHWKRQPSAIVATRIIGGKMTTFGWSCPGSGIINSNFIVSNGDLCHHFFQVKE
jgi:hypothetical protein